MCAEGFCDHIFFCDQLGEERLVFPTLHRVQNLYIISLMIKWIIDSGELTDCTPALRDDQLRLQPPSAYACYRIENKDLPIRRLP